MQRLVHALDAVKATRSRKAKVGHLAALLRVLSRDEVPIASRLVLGRVLPMGDTRALGVGWALLSAAAAEASKQPVGVVALKSREVGDFGDALEQLLPAGARHVPPVEVPSFFDRVAATHDRVEKQKVLTELLTRALGSALPGQGHPRRAAHRCAAGHLRRSARRGLRRHAGRAAQGLRADA